MLQCRLSISAEAFALQREADCPLTVTVKVLDGNVKQLYLLSLLGGRALGQALGAPSIFMVQLSGPKRMNCT